MKKLSLFGSFLVLVILGAFLAFFLKSSRAESLEESLKFGSGSLGLKFDRVIPFATSGGLIGFFDQKTGHVYIYDGNLKDCVLISRIEALGSSMKPIKTRSQDKGIGKFEEERKSQ